MLYEKSKRVPLIQRRLTTVDLKRKSSAVSRYSRSNNLNLLEASLNTTIEEVKAADNSIADETPDMFFDALDD